MRHIAQFWKTIMFTAVLFPSILSAGRYHEHKEIGDAAFVRSMDSLRRTFGEERVDSLLREALGINPHGFQFFYTTDPQLKVTFGDLSALSADHVDNPLGLFNGITLPLSSIRETVLRVHEAIDRGGDEVDDLELYKIESAYATLAASDLSHFYKYGDTYKEHIECFNLEVFKALELEMLPTFPEFSADRSYHHAIKKLEGTNAICKYITLHSFAIHLAEKAGRLAQEGHAVRSKSWLLYAVMFEAYASHYIQDAFSSGHLVVERSFIGSILNDDKIFHDLYGKAGIDVANLRGDFWVSYGDRTMNKLAGGVFRDGVIFSYYDTKVNYPDSSVFLGISERFYRPADPFKDSSFSLITFDGSVRLQYSRNMSLAIEAGTHSVNEVFTAYFESSYGLRRESFLSRIESNKDSLAPFFIRQFTALEIIPIPFHTFKYNLFSTFEGRNNGYKKDYPLISDRQARIFETINDVPSRMAVGLRTGIAFSVNVQGKFWDASRTLDDFLIGGSVTVRGLGLYDNLIAGSSWFDLSLNHYRQRDLNHWTLGIDYIPSLTSLVSLGFNTGIATVGGIDRAIAGVSLNCNIAGFLAGFGWLIKDAGFYSTIYNFYYYTNMRLQTGVNFIADKKSYGYANLQIDLNNWLIKPVSAWFF